MDKRLFSRREVLQTIVGGALTLATIAKVGKISLDTAFGKESFMFEPLVAKPLKPSLFKMDGISAKTIEEHEKLYKGYVNKTNEIMGKLATVDLATANQVFSDPRSLKVDLTFAIGGVKNHEIYFDHLGGRGGQPSGELLKMINRDFGSFEFWQKELKATGICARGWAWLAYDYDWGRLFNYLGDAQNTFPIWNTTPILALDTYEHAYFIDYGVNRSAYIDAFFKNLDWDAVQARFEALKIK